MYLTDDEMSSAVLATIKQTMPRKGIDVLSDDPLTFRCKECGETYEPKATSMYRTQWLCPNLCQRKHKRALRPTKVPDGT